MVLDYRDPPVEKFDHPAFRASGIQVSVLREDLNHHFVSGNKWWKLKENLENASKSKVPILTFGGAFSNHIYATAAACRQLGLSCYGVIRGEENKIESPTIQFAQNFGMKILRVSREQYRNKNDKNFLNQLKEMVGDFYLIPEGGSNSLAVESCIKWGEKILSKYGDSIDELALPVGTGGTMAGLVAAFQGKIFIHGFSSLKNGGFLTEQVSFFLRSIDFNLEEFWTIHTEYHFGGYGKPNEQVFTFIKNHLPVLPLDAVYTAKMVLGVIGLAERSYFKRGTRLMLLHTGGMQGNAGFEELNSNCSFS